MVRVRLNYREVSALLKSEQIRPPLRTIAEGWAANARGSALVDTGKYRDSIDVVSDTTDRAVERVISRDPKAVIIESRTGNLKRAMRG